MRTEKISDILQGMDVNMEDTIVTLSDKIWEIGELTEIKKHVSDTVFTFHVVANVIGVYKGDISPLNMDVLSLDEEQFLEVNSYSKHLFY